MSVIASHLTAPGTLDHRPRPGAGSLGYRAMNRYSRAVRRRAAWCVPNA